MTNKIVPHTQKPLLSRLLGGLGNDRASASAKAQMEAFLSACPAEYFGISTTGETLYSDGLGSLLGLDTVQGLSDIQSRLSPDDSAALEGLFERLQKHGTPFTIEARSHDERKVLKISGAHGRGGGGEAVFNILWFEDITKERDVRALFTQENTAKQAELEKFQAILDHVPRPVWLRDENQALVWINATYADFLGKSREEIIAEQREVFGHLRRKPETARNEIVPGRDMAAQALKQGKAIESRVHNIIKGNRMLMNVTEIPMAGRGVTMGIAYNVTREEELEVEMKRYQLSTRELLEQLRSAVAIFGSDQKLEFYNAAFSQLWGLEDEYLNKKPKMGDVMEKLREIRRLPEQADFRSFKQSWLNMFTSLIEPFEDMMYLPDGKALRVLVVPSSNSGLMMTFEDVSSRLELESSYNTLITVQRETLDNLAEGVAVYGGDGRLKLCNPAFSRLWKLNPEDLDGEPHISRIVEKKKSFFDAEGWEGKREELISTGLDRIMNEGRLECAGEMLIDYTAVPLSDGGVLITYADVTDSVRVENALKEKFAALEAAEKLKLDFLANVSYQLRTPLNAMMGFNEILDQEYFGPLNERQKQYTRDMRSASERLLDLINDILDLSTLEAGYLTLNRSEITVKDALQGVADLMSEWARKQKVEMVVKCAEDAGTMMADEQRLKQALVNLVRNAITYTPSGGKITISGTRTQMGAVAGMAISVADTGVGIRSEDRMRVFEPFQRAQNGSIEARVSKTGAGLGLSLVKNIVALHGGTVELESTPGKGTTVTMFFPFAGVKTNLKLPIGNQKKTKAKA